MYKMAQLLPDKYFLVFLCCFSIFDQNKSKTINIFLKFFIQLCQKKTNPFKIQYLTNHFHTFHSFWFQLLIKIIGVLNHYDPFLEADVWISICLKQILKSPLLPSLLSTSKK